MGFWMNWLIALCVVLLLFAGLYLIVKLAVKSAMKEVLNEFGRNLAKKVWDEDGRE